MFGSNKLIVLCAALFASTYATEWNGLADRSSVFERALHPGGHSFEAPETTREGSNCTAAFGEGYETCRPASATEIRLCYNPNIGQVCCQNEWGCPSDSFCLTKNYCCPKGIDPKTCADKYQVSLPSSLNTGDSGPYKTPAPSSTTYVSTTTHTSAIYSTITPSVCTKPKPVTSIVTVTLPYTTPGWNSTTTSSYSHPTSPPSTGTASPPSYSTYPPYNNAAGRIAMDSKSLVGMGLSCAMAAFLLL